MTPIDRTPELIRAIKSIYGLSKLSFKKFPDKGEEVPTTGFMYSGTDDMAKRAVRHIKATLKAMSITENASFFCRWETFYFPGRPQKHKVALKRISP